MSVFYKFKRDQKLRHRFEDNYAVIMQSAVLYAAAFAIFMLSMILFKMKYIFLNDVALYVSLALFGLATILIPINYVRVAIKNHKQKARF